MELNSSMYVLEKLSKFHLDLLPKEWVDFNWSNDFPTPLEVPPEYELQIDGNFINLLRDVRKHLKAWLDEDMQVNSVGNSRNSLTSKSWNSLVHQINHRALLCLLSAFISQFDQTASDLSGDALYINDRAVEAARLYFMLTSVEGAHIFQIFKSVIYLQCLEIFKALNTFSNQPSSTANKSKGRKRNTSHDIDVSVAITQNGFVINSCCHLIDDLHYCLSKFSLRIDDDLLNQTLKTLVQVASVERKNAYFLESRPRHNTATYLAYHAYLIIEILCSGFHGKIDNVLKNVMRAIFPCLLIFDQQSWQHLTAETVVIKDHSVDFIVRLVTSCKEESYPAVMALVQQLCVRVPDKADVRSKYIDVILSIIFKLPVVLYRNTVVFICSLCVSDTVKHRLFGVESVAKILNTISKMDKRYSLNMENSAPFNCHSSSGPPFNYMSKANISNKFLFSLIISRIKDVSPRIRIKSLSLMINILKNKDDIVFFIAEEIFVVTRDLEVRDIFNFNEYFRNLVHNTESMNPPNPLPTAGTVFNLIERLTQDAKALVRKNALHLLSEICLLHHTWLTEQRLNILIGACKDLSVGNRKLMAQCLTDLLTAEPESDLIINAWVGGVVPLFTENEIKTQEKVLELAGSIILDQIVDIDKAVTAHHKLPWKVIAFISRRDMRKLFRFGCQQWCTKKRIKSGTIESLRTYIGSDCNFAAWYFLVCISEFQDLPFPGLILQYFYDNVYGCSSINGFECQLVMQAMVLNWRRLKNKEIQDLCIKLRYSLENYVTPISLMSGSLEIVHLNDRDNIKVWAKQVLEDCQEKFKLRIRKVIKEECYSDTLMCRYIFLLGELSLICPDMIDLQTVNDLSNLIDLANIENGRINELDKSLSNFGCIQAVTVTTLGKLCLQNQFTAKDVVPKLGALVSAKTPSGIKNNANIALTDLCIRFSSLVEPFFGDMFICLKDPDPIVRRNTLNLLAMLIQEQYLKLKAHIFIYFLLMLQDPCSEIRDFTSSFIVNSLMAKDPNIIFTHFVQGIFFLNGYFDQLSIAEHISPKERLKFCLIGDENTAFRRELYIFLLQNMDDVMKFKTKYRICIEILHPIAEGRIPLGAKGVIILKDSLYILGCDEIKMSIRKVGKDGNMEAEDDEVADAVTVAKTNVMSQLYSSFMKKNLMENVIPIIKNLKHKLQSCKSPLVSDVMVCLREILKDFTKEEVQEILAVDPVLAAEVLHDIRRHEGNDGCSNQSQEEPGLSSPQDVVMEQMAQLARRISSRVILHGPESISEVTNDSNL